MKKIFFALLFVFLISSVSFGASEDVYVRKDVFDAKTEVMLERIDHNSAILLERIEKLDAKIDNNFAILSERIDGNMRALSGQISGFNYKIESMQNSITWWLGFLTLVVTAISVIAAMPFVKKWYENRKAQAVSLTREEVMKIVEQLETKISSLQSQIGR